MLCRVLFIIKGAGCSVKHGMIAPAPRLLRTVRSGRLCYNRSMTGISNKPIRIAIIATYPEMSKIIQSMAQEMNIEVLDFYASFEEAVIKAKEVEGKVDGIISRGGTGAMIQESIQSIPVVSTPITPFDVYLSISNLAGSFQRFAFSNYDRKIFGIQKIADRLHVLIEEYTFKNKEDILTEIDDMIRKDIPILIGGNVAAIEAEKAGLVGVEIDSGREAVHRSLHELLELIRIQRQEKAQADRMQMMLNEMSEGIIMTDADQNVVLTNPAARRMLKLEFIRNGEKLDALLTSRIRLDKAYREREAVKDYIKEIRGSTFAINHFPIINEGRLDGIVSTFEDVTKIQQLESDIRKKLLAKGFTAKHTFDDLITATPAFASLIETARVYAKTDSSILLEGETGTGKEMFAQAIHNASRVSNGPFVAVNCSAIPENLLESELFGYDAGAFTGARKEGKQGLFELAHNGTLFLDEITEIPMHLQPRLLRIIQEREFMRLGGDRTMSVNVRIVCATNRDVRKLVRENLFRADLYYRLSVFELRISPLRERKGDILPFLRAYLTEELLSEKQVQELVDRLTPTLLAHDWPGNVRELQSVAERIALFSEIGVDPKEGDFLFHSLISANKNPQIPAASDAEEIPVSNGGLKGIVDEYESNLIQKVVDRFDGDQAKAAEFLKISKTTLWRKWKKES